MKAKDSRDIEKARNAILRLFPQIPLASCQTVLDHGFQKGSGRVGRSTVLDDDHKVTLAIVAHVRHTMTPYETLLRELDRDGVGKETRRETARGMIRGCVEDVLSRWRSSSPNTVLKPIKQRPKAKPVRVKNLKVRSQRTISSGCRGPPDTKVKKSTKGAAGSSFEASIHAVRSKSKGLQNTNLPATAPATRHTSRTISQETTASAITRDPARTRGRDSRGGFSTAHMTNSLEASIHATGSFSRSFLETDKISAQCFRATCMTGHNSPNESIQAVKYTSKAAPAMNIGTRSKPSTDHMWDVSQKKRSREIDEGTPKAKRIKGEEATAGASIDVQDCYASTTADFPITTSEYVNDDADLPLVLDTMHLDDAAFRSRNMFQVGKPLLSHAFTSKRTANILKGNPMATVRRLKHLDTKTAVGNEERHFSDEENFY